jgi:hypothetical protein
MRPLHEGDPVPRLRETIEAIAERLRELDRFCREATALLERLADERTRAGGAPEASLLGAQAESAESRLSADGSGPAGHRLDERQAALLVGLTLRGGTMETSTFAALAAELGVGSAAVDELFAGADPYLVQRAGGAPGVTERGLESAADWRRTLPAELLRTATAL